MHHAVCSTHPNPVIPMLSNKRKSCPRAKNACLICLAVPFALEVRPVLQNISLILRESAAEKNKALYV